METFILVSTCFLVFIIPTLFIIYLKIKGIKSYYDPPVSLEEHFKDMGFEFHRNGFDFIEYIHKKANCLLTLHRKGTYSLSVHFSETSLIYGGDNIESNDEIKTLRDYINNAVFQFSHLTNIKKFELINDELQRNNIRTAIKDNYEKGS